MVIWHATLTTTLGLHFPSSVDGFAAPPAPESPVGSLPWLFFETPLRYLTMGSHAVSVFFVLSGVVLTLPLLRGRGMDLWSYYPRRLVRLWAPTCASFLFAALLIVLVRQSSDEGITPWAKAFSFDRLEPDRFVASFIPITGENQYNNPTWSLKWELLFSLFLPIAFIALMAVRKGLWGLVVLCAVASGIGHTLGVSSLQYGPMFIAGMLMARVVMERERTPSRIGSWMLVLGGFALIGVPDAVRVWLEVDIRSDLPAFTTAFVVCGACLVIAGLTAPSGVTSLFGSRLFRYLGRVSFSLYLVHVPILIAGVNLFDGRAVWALAVTIPASFVIAELFTRFVEEPSARWAKKVGEYSSRRARELAAPHSSAQ